MDTEAACINNDPLIRSSIAKVVAIPWNTCIIQPMNKILYSQAKPHGNLLLVPFTCSDAEGYRLHEPSYNRTNAEQAKAEELGRRIRLACAAHGLALEGISWTSMHITVKVNT